LLIWKGRRLGEAGPGTVSKGKFDMVKRKNILASDDRAKLVHAVGKIQRQINWKVGKDLAHLNKRRQMKHLQPSATMLCGIWGRA
jgi:hypothetical protein